MEAGYRVPKIEEFVQGFEFEVAHEYSFGVMDMTNGGTCQMGLPFKIWEPCKVWWKEDPNKRIVQELGSGSTIEFSGATMNFFKPFDEQMYIDQELVRVKI